MKEHYSALLLLSALFFILDQGNSEKYGISSIQIHQSTVGASSNNNLDTVFQVEVRNLCRCAVKSVLLTSNGFASSVAVDPNMFRQEGNNYILNDGRAIASQSSVTFRYAWDHYFKMSPASLQAAC